MKQVLQSARSGELELVEVPAPSPGRGQVLVRNEFSLVSPGTEKLAMSFARKSLLAKARSRPDLTRQVIRKLRQEGPLSTYRTVMTRLESPQPLGYSCSGVVIEVGDDVGHFAPGDRVACAGAGYANHAEFVVVPENLVARVPDGVSLEHASFSTLGAIALQGLRVAEPTLGEICVVIGLGLIGQLTVQLARANGCRVLAVDIDPMRVELARANGAEWSMTTRDLSPAWTDEHTGGYGVDFALVTAAAETSEPLQLAAELCRLQGRVIMVGAMPIELDRRMFYEKALSLRMSTSYGPGRYDRNYEESGLDYPLPYVRWTENRNLQSFLALIASGAVRPETLQTPVVPFAEATRTYGELAAGSSRSLAIVFRYDAEKESPLRTLELTRSAAAESREARATIGVGFIGAGNYAKAVLLPALEQTQHTERVAIVTATGPSALRTGEKFGFTRCSTDAAALIGDRAVDLVFVTTRHDSHAHLAVDALRAGKAVWLEKPVGLHEDEVGDVAQAVQETGGFLVVGYNRRFSAHARAIKQAFARRQGSLAIHYVIAAGPPPRGTWLLDPREGGGRIVGEACHFVDLCTYLVGSPPVSVYARALSHDPEGDDSMVSVLGFADGSTAAIEYLAKASPSLPKERFEVSCDGRTARCDNFRSTTFSDGKDFKTFNQDKGQATAIEEVVDALRQGRSSPFTLFEIVGVSMATFAMLESARTRREIRLDG
jgi:predicted dehydrogenase/threonine dehydrogenase-like Zn-dependent dehydrogenase